MSERYRLIDDIRGFALVNMILFHAIWDLVYLYGVEWSWFVGVPGEIWQQAICWTFILVSGFCLSFSSQPLKHGVEVSLAGLAVTFVTLGFMPQACIIFGVLTCIGVCMLLLGVVRPFLERLQGVAGWMALLFLVLFLFTRGLIDGYVGFGKWLTITVNPSFYKNLFTTFLGMPMPGFYSADYFPLIPWLFLFACGYFLSLWLAKNNKLHIFRKSYCRALSWAGRHSLFIYLLHQPIIFVLLRPFFPS